MECEHRVSVLSGGSFGTRPTLVLSVESPGRLQHKACSGPDADLARMEDDALRVFGRVLIDCCEGTQRLCAQFRLKSSKINAVLLSKLDHATAGGVGGIYFSLADAGSPELAVRGPEGTEGFMASIKRFVHRRWPEVSCVDVQRNSCHQAKYEELGLVDLLMVTLKMNEDAHKDSKYCHWCAVDRARDASDDEDSDSSEDEEDSSSDNDEDEDEDEDDDDDDEEEDEDEDEDEDEEKETTSNTEVENSDGRTSSDLGSEDLNQATIAYIVRLWQHVQYDGRAPVRSGASTLVAVVNCPSKEYLGSLHHSVHFKAEKSCDHVPKVFLHMSHRNVIESEAYQTWVGKYTEARHIFVHESFEELKPDPFSSSARWSARLRQFCPTLLPVAQAEIFPESSIKSQKGKSQVKELQPKGMEPTGDQLMAGIHIRVKHGDVFLDYKNAQGVALQRKLMLKSQLSATDSNSEQKNQASVPTTTATSDENELCIDDVAMDTPSESGTGSLSPYALDTSITFLGTGSAKPAKLRNCSGILVTLANNQGYGLLDVGEGSYSQLVRLYGSTQADEIVRNLQWICISHAHLDHHGGLGRILEIRAKQEGGELPIFGPTSINDALNDLQTLWPSFKFLFQHLEQLRHGLPPSLAAMSCKVYHCFDAYAMGLLVPTREGPPVWLVYSGDTRPCPRMWRELCSPPRHAGAALYRVLIHEATFDDTRKEQALRKKHSTIGEAYQAATSMAANLLILTHFSQRYPKGATAQLPKQMPTIFAADLMRIPLLSRLDEMHALASAQRPELAIE